MKKLLIAIAVGIAGFGLNALNIELFFGVNIIFGGILPMLVVLTYGAWYGALSALIASLYTYLLWGHPYAIVIFTVEAIAVGLLTRRSKRWALAADLAFWIVAGIPLVYVFYHFVLGLPLVPTLVIALKQPTNSIFNLSVSGALLLWKPIRKRLMESRFQLPSLSEYINATLTISVGTILLVVTALLGAQNYAELNQQIRANQTRMASSIEKSLDNILESNSQGVGLLAGVIPTLIAHEDDPARQKKEAHDVLLSLRTHSPLLNKFFVVDPHGRFEFEIAPAGSMDSPIAGKRLLTRENIGQLEANGERGTIWSSEDINGTTDPSLLIIEPVHDDNGGLAHYVIGVVPFDILRKSLNSFNFFLSDSDARVIFTNSSGKIIYSSHATPGNPAIYDRGKLSPLDGGFAMKFPPGELPAMVRWGRSAMVYSAPLKNLDWTIYVEQPLRRFQTVMQKRIIQLLSNLLLFMGCFVIISGTISAFVNRQVRGVLAYANTAQEHIQLERIPERTSQSAVYEIEMLYENIQNLEHDLLRAFQLERFRFEELQEALQKLKQTQIELELQTSQHARIDAYRDFVHTVGNLITPARVKVNTIAADRHTVDYIDQLQARMSLLLQKLKEGKLTEYLAENAENDFSGFQRGLEFMKDINIKQREDVRTVENALDKIVDSTTSQSRLQKELAVLEEVDLVMVIKAVISLMEENWREKGIKVDFTVNGRNVESAAAEILLKVEKVRLFNAIQNVLKNAGETFDGNDGTEKKIGIALSDTDAGVIMKIVDTGRGMTAEEISQLGQIGYTTKSGAAPGEGGSGLGIHNIQIFMAGIGGHFLLESSGTGKGAETTMTFPAEVRV